MRKLLCLLAILALTAPLFAGTITLTVDSDNHDGTFTVGYSSYTDAAPVGLAVEIDMPTGETISAQELALYDGPAADSFFDVFIDYAAGDPATYLANASTATGAWLGTAQPLAVPGTTAGPATLPLEDVSICMGSLVGTAPASVVALAHLTVGDGAATGCIIDLDTNRGGVVDVNGDPMTVYCSVNGGAPQLVGGVPSVTFNVDIECYAGQPDYATWVAVGKPDCWCFPRQCHGDADNAKEGSTKLGYWYVGNNDLNIMTPAWKVLEPAVAPIPSGPGLTGNQICADFAHDKEGTTKLGYWRVGNNDLNLMSAYWKVLEPAVAPIPSGPGTPADCMD